MEVAECTKIVLNRIQRLEPENAIKIIGYLLLNHNSQEIIEYAFGPDKQIISLINKAKAYLSSSPKLGSAVPMQHVADQPLPVPFAPFLPTISRPFSSPASFRVQAPYVDPHLPPDQQSVMQNLDIAPHPYADLMGEDSRLHSHAEFLGLEDQLNPLNPLGTDLLGSCYYPEPGLRTNVRSPAGMPDFPVKACHYFYKGYCKHGINCRYFHGQGIPDNLSQMHSLNLNEMANDEHVFTPGSLEKLEMEIAELLRARNGTPVSIASLPMMYLERYGKALQAEGYLTESQRHGKAGFSLTKLLARLKSSIRLIDRPHGQHSVVLAEDAPKYMMDYRNERTDPGALASSSHQIYLTFPADSTFTEDDVSNYFQQFGPVHDVRIPRQEKRMFGFVSFLYAETVRLILSKGCPHYICGARVLVKPYKEKSQLVDRKYMEKIELPIYHPSQYFDVDPELNMTPFSPSVSRVYDNSRLLRRQLMEDHERVLELERRRLLELQLTPKPLIQQSYLGHKMEELKLQDDNFAGILNNSSSSDDKARQTSNNYSDQESGHIELPDSPFASPRIGNSVSTVI